jgi:nicotinamide-nucleotide amidase
MAPDLDALAAQVGERLLHAGLRLASAESCTGGLVAATCTDIAGSSDWFDCGVVTYSLDAKAGWLGVGRDTLERHGAVSQPTAAAMVLGLLARCKADVGVAVTGIAGPGGGEPTLPVGSVWFAWALREQGRPRLVHSGLERFDGTRRSVREAAVRHVLEGVLRACSIVAPES